MKNFVLWVHVIMTKTNAVRENLRGVGSTSTNGLTRWLLHWVTWNVTTRKSCIVIGNESWYHPPLWNGEQTAKSKMETPSLTQQNKSKNGSGKGTCVFLGLQRSPACRISRRWYHNQCSETETRYKAKTLWISIESFFMIILFLTLPTLRGMRYRDLVGKCLNILPTAQIFHQATLIVFELWKEDIGGRDLNLWG